MDDSEVRAESPPVHQYSRNERIRFHTARRRRASRKKNIFISVIVVMALIVLFVLFAMTVFCRIDTVQVEGGGRYAVNDVIAVSGLQTGDNIFTIKKEAVEEKITSTLVYIGSVEVSHKLPSTVILKLTETNARYAAQVSSDYVLFDKTGKVLENNSPVLPDGCLPTFGLVTIGTTLGEPVSTEEDPAFRALLMLDQAIDASGIQGLTSVDVSDPNNMTAVFENRATLLLGDTDSLRDKLLLADEVIRRENQTNDKRVMTVDLTSGKRAVVRDAAGTAIPVETNTQQPTVSETYGYAQG